MPTLRQGFTLSPRTVVRRGELHAKVTCWLRFSPDEIAATKEIFQLAEIREKVPDEPEVKLTWTYPNPSKPLNLSPTNDNKYQYIHAFCSDSKRRADLAATWQDWYVSV